MEAQLSMMMKRLSSIFSLVVLTLSAATAQQPPQPFRDSALPMERRIDNLLSLMTLDEKIGRAKADHRPG